MRFPWFAVLVAAAGLVAAFLIGFSIHAQGATITHYRRPITVLVGISPSKTVVFRCHNADHDLPRVFGFGGCKQVKA